MRKIIMSYLTIMLLPIWVYSQSNDQNYVKKTSYRSALTTPLPSSPDIQHGAVTVTYFDGMGEVIQQIAHKQSASGRDIISHSEYDVFGRKAKEYLPYVSASQSNMAFINGVTAKSETLGYYPGEVPSSEKKFDGSPLNRVLEQGAPGNDWQLGSHPVKYEYLTNLANEVKMFRVNVEWNETNGYHLPIPVNFAGNIYYAAGELYKKQITDENGSKAEEFKDKEGKLLLKRVFNGNIAHDTYYVYDPYGNLTYVIPPNAVDMGALLTNVTVLDYSCYQYRYDARNRVVEKKIPGKAWEYIVYDKLNRLVAVGPVFSPFTDNSATIGWKIIKYDLFGREAYTGWNSVSGTFTSSVRKSLQSLVSAMPNIYVTKSNTTLDGIQIGYANNSTQPEVTNLLTVQYYDDYSYPSGPTSFPVIEGASPVTVAKGQPTGNWIRILATNASKAGKLSYDLYDDKYRIIRSYNQNHLGGYTQFDSKLNFTGTAAKIITRQKHNTSASVLVITDLFTYDHRDLLLKHTQQIGTGAVETISNNTYDELGLLKSKKVGGKDPLGVNSLQSISYKYNIRNWLTDVTGELFNYYIHYNGSFIFNNNPLYNGNIDFVLWTSKTDNIMRGYDYNYDGLNRLTDGRMLKLITDFTNVSQIVADGSYMENLSYDKNGNIQALERTGENINGQVVALDALQYTYTEYLGNKLQSISDNTNNTEGFNDVNKTGNDYTYDTFGNITSDKNKGITTVSYNHQNLPFKVTFSNGGTISYTYDAMGTRLAKKVQPSGGTAVTTDYVNGFQYENGVLQFFPHAEGYVKRNADNTYLYAYQYKDHLGNIRLSYADINGNGSINLSNEILEENNYYPFGLKHKGYNEITNTNRSEAAEKYKFGGKELNNELGLDLYDFGARNYDAAIGRWLNMDPLAEEFNSWTPYHYVHNNPVNLIDPTGMFADGWIRDSGGNMSYHPSFTAENTPEGYTYMDMYQDEKQGLIYDTNGKVSRISDGRSVNWSRSERFEGMSYHYAKDGAEIRTYNRDAWNSDSAVFNDWRKRSSGIAIPVDVTDVLGELVFGYVQETTGSNILAFAAVVMLPGGTKGIGEKVSKGGTQLLLKPGAANLTQKGLDHIVARHWFTSGAKGAGKFAEGTTGAGLKSMINTTTTQGVFRANTMGRAGTIAEYNFGKVIGTTSGGAPASSLRVVIGTNGNVITAFPF